MKPRTAVLLIVLAALAGLATLGACAPAYLTHRGFPLDDAWIHAVYGRSLARSGTLAYNPGVPATGATSPLWAVVVAIPHLLAGSPLAAVLLIKLSGFLLHVAAAVVLFFALAVEPAPIEGMAGAMLVAVHPDLISASVSGMEVPLAALAACTLLYAARHWPPWAYGIVCALAPLARPEMGLLCYGLPFLLYVGAARRRLFALGGAAILGNAVCFGAMALRNLAVSGLPLPATFYAKVTLQGLPLWRSEVIGFTVGLGHIAGAHPLILIAILAAAAATPMLRHGATADRPAAAAFLGALVFCGVSFFLVRALDPQIFYCQRYILPAVTLLVGAVPLLAHDVLRRVLSSRALTLARGAVLVVLAAGVLLEAPARYRQLSNDAHNIDDVQVAIGRALAGASARDVVWATDAGAIRYFGGAFVVDLAGLNNAAMLDGHAQGFLDAHPPRYLEIVGGWTALDDYASRRLHARLFHPSTQFTITGFTAMRNQWLVYCPRDFGEAWIRVMGQVFHFRCAP